MAMCTSGDASGSQSLPPVPYTGQVSGKVMSSAGYFQESTYSNPIPWCGRFDVCLINLNWEQSDSGGTHDRGLLVDAIQQIMHVGTNNPTEVWQYHIYEYVAKANGAPYNSYYPTVQSEKWMLYGASNQSGTPVTDSYSSSQYSANWAVAYPGTVNGVAADQLISPGRTVAQYDGQPEDLLQYAAAYFIEETVARHTPFTGVVCGTIPASAYSDSRWYPTLTTGANHDAMKAPNIGAICTDNLFCIPQTAGYYDLANSYAADDYGSAVTPWFARGAQHFKERSQQILAACYPGRTYHNVGNIGQFLKTYLNNPSQFSTRMAGLAGYLDGGLLEGTVGASWSCETEYGTALTIEAVQAVMDFCIGPKLVAVHGYPSSSTDYQTGRYTLGIALMARALCCLSVVNSYKISDQMYLDEFGGNPGTNVRKGWLGAALGSRPTAAAVNGVWIARYANGVVLLNPRGNNSQTVTLSQINAYLGASLSLHFIQGVQDTSVNPGGTFSSAVIADHDALLLMA
jgi:hypothetical protein